MKTKYNVSLEHTYLGPVYSVDDRFYHLEDMPNTSTPIANIDDNNNNRLVFSGPHYECRMKSLAMGCLRFYAGHLKHAFSTCDRKILCKVIKGQMKVKSGSQKWTVTKNATITLDPNSKYFVKNNSLRNDCVVTFTFNRF